MPLRYPTYLLCFLFLLGTGVRAQTAYYVSPDGDDGNDGLSLATAWATITYGVETIQPGDTLLVNDGIYVETDIKIRQRSTADKPTVVKSINQWGAKIESRRQYATILSAFEAEHVVIDGFEVYNPQNRPFADWNSGIDARNSNYVTIQNNYSHDCGCGGIGGRESDYLIIRRNVTRDNAKTNPYNCSGISIYQPTQLDDLPGTHILIQENVCFENECRLPFSPLGFDVPTDGNGIILDDFNHTQDLDDDGIRGEPYVAEVIIENNLVFNNGGAGVKLYEIANAIVRNNTLAYNNYVLSEYGEPGEIGVEFVNGDIEVYNNIVIQNFNQDGYALNYIPKTAASRYFASNNLAVGETEFRRTPALLENIITANYDRQSLVQFAQIIPDDFTFTSVDDFRPFFALRPGSPALGAGAAEYAPATDLTGAPRPTSGAIDLGAFEGAEPGVGPNRSDRVRTADIPATEFPISLDGNRDAAYTSSPLEVDRILTGRISNEEDLSGHWTATYDDENLYVLVEVEDNRLRNNSNDPREDDGVTIYIDADNSRGDAYDGVNDFQYVFGWNDDAVREFSRNATAGVEQAQRSGFTNYVKEVSIPWSTLGVSPSEGNLIGIEVALNDDDNDGNADGVLGWQDRDNSARTSPLAFGNGLLTAADKIPPIVELGSSESIALDGLLDDSWSEATVNVIGNVIEGAIDGNADLSATWRARWSPVFLYLFVNVTDDERRANSSDWYNDDSVEFYFDMGLDRSTEYDANDKLLTVIVNGSSVQSQLGTLGQGARTQVVYTDSGYDVEVRLPWASLGYTPVAGNFFGIDVQINDDDDVSHRDAKLAWHATADESEEDPSTFGTTFLSGRPSAIFDAATALPLNAFPNPTAGELTLQLPGTERVSVDVIDLQGRRVLQFTDVAPNGTVQLGELPAGSYVISASSSIDTFRKVITVQR